MATEISLDLGQADEETCMLQLMISLLQVEALVLSEAHSLSELCSVTL